MESVRTTGSMSGFSFWRFRNHNRNRNRNPMNRLFDHEKLEVYQVSLSFIGWLDPVLQRLPKRLSVSDQLDRASTSIPLNIAEGNGKFTSADRCRFFDNARGSALESAAALDVLAVKGLCSQEEVLPGKDRLWSIVSMLVGLIKANSDYRLHENSSERRLRSRLRVGVGLRLRSCKAEG
jgi:four helix bundle protein